MSDMFFGTTDNLQKKVNAGEIKGFASWPVSGQARLVSVGKLLKAGAPYLSFKLSSKEGVQEFLVRLPQESDKEMAKFLSMQRIYKTLFVIGGSDPATHPVSEAFERAQKAADGRALEVAYTLSEYESVSQATGKTFKNQSLESLNISTNMDIF